MVGFNHFAVLINKRKLEFDEFFNIGRTLIITSPIFYESNYKINNDGTSSKLDLIDCIPIKKPNFDKVQGKNIEAIDQPFIQEFLQSNKKRFSYEIIFLNPSGTPLMRIKDTKYVVSQFYKVSSGLIIILPQFQLNPSDMNDGLAFLVTIEKLIQDIREYTTPNELDIPDWVDHYDIIGEENEREKLNGLKLKQAKLINSISTQQLKLQKYKRMKALFSSDGKTLEEITQEIFKDIGFQLEKLDPNRDDIIIKNGSKIAVVEIKGTIKSSAEKHATQLQKWVTNYHIESGQIPKGILIVNTFRNTPLEERNDEDFPDQMLTYAKQMQHCLITGVQLLFLYLDFKSGNISQKKLIDLLFNTVGVLEYSKDPVKYINFKNTPSVSA